MNIDDINENQEPVEEQGDLEPQEPLNQPMEHPPVSDTPPIPQVPPLTPDSTPPTGYSPLHGNRLDLDKIQAAVDRIKDELAKVIVGQEEMIDLLLAALLTSGHVLVEGVPGIAKTLLAKLTAKTMSTEFARIQLLRI